MNFIAFIFQDWNYNKGNTKGKIIAVLFRIAVLCSKKYIKFILFPYLIFYRFFVEWVLGTELPWQTKVGKGISIFHGQSLVINKDVIIGDNCVLRHCTTIGNAERNGKCPSIGNNVNIGANVCIIGNIKIGDNVIIGAGTVVIKDIPSNHIAVGNPARIISKKK